MRTYRRQTTPCARPIATAKADPATVALATDWRRDLPAEEVRRYANSDTPAVRQAAAEVPGEFTDQAPPAGRPD